jgi:hypothetical protein
MRALILTIIQILAAKKLQVVQLQADVLAKAVELAEKVASIADLELRLANAMASDALSKAEVQAQTDRALAAESAATAANESVSASMAANATLQTQLSAAEATLLAVNEAESLEDLAEAELAAMLQGVVDAEPAPAPTAA